MAMSRSLKWRGAPLWVILTVVASVLLLAFSKLGSNVAEVVSPRESMKTVRDVIAEHSQVKEWSAEDLQRLHRDLINTALFNAEPGGIEGFSGQVPAEVQFLYENSKRERPTTICEIGFNAGHSAATLMAGSADTVPTYYGFDIGMHLYAAPNFGTLKSIFNDRMHITWGDSTQTVGKYFDEHPEVKCDLLHVDGGHEGDVPIIDLRNMKKGAHAESLVLIDDVNCEESYCRAPQQAWDQAKAEGWLQELECHSSKTDPTIPAGRGFCSGRFIMR